MRADTLGSSGLVVPALILGCGNFHGIGSPAHLAGKGDDRDTAFALLDRALKLGIDMFDTANSYGGGVSEQWLGEWVASRGVRDRVLLSTKVAMPVGPGEQGLSAAHIGQQVEVSLRRLGTDRLDLYLAHGPDDDTPIEETVAAFGALVDAGKIRYYGVCNFSRSQLVALVDAADRLGTHRPVNLQHGYNLLQRSTATTFDVCARDGIGFTAYSPLAGGFLTGKYRADRPAPAGSRLTLRPDGFDGLSYDAVSRLETVAAQRGLQLSTMALAWAVTDPGVSALVIGPRTPEQLTQMCRALDVQLTESDRAELVALT